MSVPEQRSESELFDHIIERENAPRARFSLLNDMWVEPGSKADWELLHDLHYKAEALPTGPKFHKLTLEGETIGVLVTGNPRGLLKERHIVFPKLKPGAGETVVTNTQRYNYINKNFRVISRFVLDTMYRGVGAGYRMMNLAARIEGKSFMEIQSSMSKFNMFGQKAGFQFVKPLNSNKFDAGLSFFRQRFESNPADLEAILLEIEALSPYQRDRMILDCKEFYYRHSALEKTGSNRDRGQGRVDDMETRVVIKSLQQLILASPMYGIWQNPDPGIVIPTRVPLIAFDKQGPNEKFRI